MSLKNETKETNLVSLTSCSFLLTAVVLALLFCSILNLARYNIRLIVIFGDCRMQQAIYQRADEQMMIRKGWSWILYQTTSSPCYDEDSDIFYADGLITARLQDDNLEQLMAVAINGSKININDLPFENYEGIHFKILNRQAGSWLHFANYVNRSLQVTNKQVIFLGGSPTAFDQVSSLSGRHLVTCTHADSDNGGWQTVWTKGVPENESFIRDDQLDGFNVELYRTIAELLNFTYQWRYPRDRNWGGRDLITGKYSGIFMEIQAGYCDIGAAVLTVTHQRNTGMDFTAPFLESGLSFIIKKREAVRDPFRFLYPYRPNVWLMLVITVTVFGLVLALLDRISPYEYRGEFVLNYHDMDMANRSRETRKHFYNYHKKAIDHFGFLNSQFYAWTALFQDSVNHPRSLSARICTLVWWGAVSIIIATYTANMAAVLTAQGLAKGIESVEDLAAQDSIRYGTDHNSGPWSFFEASNQSPYKYMRQQMIRYATGVTYEEGIRKARTGKYAFIFDKSNLDFEAMRAPCDLASIDTFNRIVYGWTLPKHSPFTQELSVHLLQMRERGLINTLLEKWFWNRSECSQEVEVAALAPLPAFNMLGVFMVLYFLMVLSALILMLEWAAVCWKTMRGSEWANIHTFREAFMYRWRRLYDDFHQKRIKNHLRTQARSLRRIAALFVGAGPIIHPGVHVPHGWMSETHSETEKF